MRFTKFTKDRFDCSSKTVSEKMITNDKTNPIYKVLGIPALLGHPSCSNSLMRYLLLQTWKNTEVWRTMDGQTDLKVEIVMQILLFLRVMSTQPIQKFKLSDWLTKQQQISIKDMGHLGRVILFKCVNQCQYVLTVFCKKNLGKMISSLQVQKTHFFIHSPTPNSAK